MGLGGINSVGTGQIQEIAQPPVENGAPGEGQVGSHTVKVGEPDASSAQLKNQLGESLSSATSAERAIANFLSQTEDLGRNIQAKMVEGGRANEALSFKSLLAREINRRAGEWIDTMSNLAEEGVPSADLEEMSRQMVDGLKAFVDQAFADKANVETADEPDGIAPFVEVPPSLTEASSVYRSQAASVLGTTPEKTHVYENIGGGSCFFHAALQQLVKLDPAKCSVANTRGSADKLRQALIAHVGDLKVRLEGGEAHGLKTDEVVIGGKTVRHVFARTSDSTDLKDLQPITEGFDLALEPSFAQYATMADVSTAALLADYLQRPVTVIAQTSDGKGHSSVNTMEFKYGLASGQKLSGEPLLLYYDQAAAHFMAVDVER